MEFVLTIFACNWNFVPFQETSQSILSEFNLLGYYQGLREGGQGVQWPLGPWVLGGPWEGPSKWNIEDFFFLRSPEFGQKNGFNFGGDLTFCRSLKNPEKIVPFSLHVLDCTKPERRNIWVVPGPTLGSRRPWILPLCWCRRVARNSQRGGTVLGVWKRSPQHLKILHFFAIT